MGGKEVYIKGTNFDPDPTRNKVFFGPYACIINAEGNTEQNIACIMPPATDPDYTWALAVTVESEGKSAVTCTDGACKFNYREDRTPFIDEIIPRSAVGDTELTVWGAHRITDLGDERSEGAG